MKKHPMMFTSTVMNAASRIFTFFFPKAMEPLNSRRPEFLSVAKLLLLSVSQEFHILWCFTSYLCNHWLPSPAQHNSAQKQKTFQNIPATSPTVITEFSHIKPAGLEKLRALKKQYENSTINTTEVHLTGLEQQQLKHSKHSYAAANVKVTFPSHLQHLNWSLHTSPDFSFSKASWMGYNWCKY